MIGRSPDGVLQGFLHYAVSRPGAALSLSTMPRRRTTPNGFNEWLVCESVEWARANGFRRISLNFAPFAAVLAPGRRPLGRPARAEARPAGAERAFPARQPAALQPQVLPGLAAPLRRVREQAGSSPDRAGGARGRGVPALRGERKSGGERRRRPGALRRARLGARVELGVLGAARGCGHDAAALAATSARLAAPALHARALDGRLRRRDRRLGPLRRGASPRAAVARPGGVCRRDRCAGRACLAAGRGKTRSPGARLARARSRWPRRSCRLARRRVAGRRQGCRRDGSRLGRLLGRARLADRHDGRTGAPGGSRLRDRSWPALRCRRRRHQGGCRRRHPARSGGRPARLPRTCVRRAPARVSSAGVFSPPLVSRRSSRTPFPSRRASRSSGRGCPQAGRACPGWSRSPQSSRVVQDWRAARRHLPSRRTTTQPCPFARAPDTRASARGPHRVGAVRGTGGRAARHRSLPGLGRSAAARVRPVAALVRTAARPAAAARHLPARPGSAGAEQRADLGRPPGPRPVRGRQPRRPGPPVRAVLVGRPRADRRSRTHAADPAAQASVAAHRSPPRLRARREHGWAGDAASRRA